MLNKDLLAPEVQAYIGAHVQEDIAQFSLKKSPFEGITSGEGG